MVDERAFFRMRQPRVESDVLVVCSLDLVVYVGLYRERHHASEASGTVENSLSMGRAVQRHKSCDGRDDLLSIMVKVNRQAKRKTTKRRLILQKFWRCSAGAIQEGQLQSFAKQVTAWGKTNLKNWKKIEKG